MKKVIVSNNYYVADALGYLRDKKSDIKAFRYFADRLIKILISGALDGLKLKEMEAFTEFEKIQVKRIADEFILIPVLRAGVAMLTPALELLPNAKVGFAGLVRDEKTAIAKEYYWKVPVAENQIVLILDPMIVTGGSILYVLRKLKLEKTKEIRIMNSFIRIVILSTLSFPIP
ncbi:uracil phosphoribosyltransferase [Candidatus Daviesbacteria bacterium]|nr:uracil phosphoribosyltransferase [Candidatus Daviesbacteria bacterium]